LADEIEEELAPLTEALEPPPTDTYDDQLNTTNKQLQNFLGYMC